MVFINDLQERCFRVHYESKLSLRKFCELKLIKKKDLI